MLNRLQKCYKIIQSYDDLLQDLKDSRDYEFYLTKIEVLKLVLKSLIFIEPKVQFFPIWSEKRPKPNLDNLEEEFQSLHNKLIKSNDL